MNAASDKELFEFLANAPKEFRDGERIKKFQLKNGDYIHCVLWNLHFFITGTDIVKILVWRFQNAGRSLASLKKFEEGVFSDLRNLKPGIDATLEGPRSEFLEFLYKNGCIRTQKKQKVFYWYSVPHDALFCDALERDLRRETNLFTYNKYISNLARTNMFPHGAAGFGSHTRQNSKRLGSEMDPRYLRSMENKAAPASMPYSTRVQLQDSETFFDQQSFKKQAPGSPSHGRHRPNVYDRQFEEIRRSNFLNPPAYQPFSIKDKLFSSAEEQPMDYDFRRTDDLFSANPFGHDFGEKKTRPGSELQPNMHSELSSVLMDDIPGGFSFDDFMFLKQRVEQEDSVKSQLKEDDGQRMSQDGVSLIPNTRGSAQK
jgi:transcription factor STE12